jgi:solute carrier family 30 (zinc transporter), member 1
MSQEVLEIKDSKTRQSKREKLLRQSSNSGSLEDPHSALSLEERRINKKNAKRFALMCVLTGTFLIVEIVFGLITNSLALLTDAFHMMSDLIAMLIGFWALRISKRARNKQFSYGFVRAETISGLVNSVFLISVCIFISFEAIGRFFDPPDLKVEESLMIVGAIGLVINILGMALFHSDGEGGGHHGHSHGGHGHSHGGHGHSHGGSGEGECNQAAKSSSAQHNIYAVYLHILGDALGSIGDWEGAKYADPVLSLCISAIILYQAVPLVKQTAGVLLQSVPSHINITGLKTELLQLPSQQIVALHEVHVCELANGKAICSMHMTLKPTANFMPILLEVKKVLHRRDIHLATIQPEWVIDGTNKTTPNPPGMTGLDACDVSCVDDCEEDLCCADNTDDNVDDPPFDFWRELKEGTSELFGTIADSDSATFGEFCGSLCGRGSGGDKYSTKEGEGSSLLTHDHSHSHSHGKHSGHDHSHSHSHSAHDHSHSHSHSAHDHSHSHSHSSHSSHDHHENDKL